MSEFDEKLNALLSDPGSMAQVVQLAQQLSGTFGGESQPSAPASPPPPKPPSPTVTADGSLFNGLDPKLISRFMPLIQEYGRTNSNTTQLLYALRPFLKPEKQDKIERAAKLARLIHLGKKFLSEWEG